MTLSNGKEMMLNKWLRLFRLPNLAMIILTQYLLGYGIIRPVLHMQKVEAPLGNFNFALLVFVTVLIASAGYLINDHFDVNTDRRNKPGRNMLDGNLSVRKAMRLYYLLNGIGILTGFYLAYLAGSFQLGLIFPAIIGLLWFYSSRYQRMPFWGNLIVAFLSAMVLLIIWLFEFFMLLANSGDFVNVINLLDDINLYVWAYAVFAFLLSLVREMVKDVQDMEGDRLSGYRTLPVLWGMHKAKWLIVFITIIIILLLAAAQYFLFTKGMILPFWYLLIAVQSIFVYFLVILLMARSAEAFGFLGTTAKVLMLAGILSMELIYISF
ncbi:MAG TPA: geranylgeranylglycerol-phosphate geranylgeranyltransferase [Bacteroidales bacterium]|nr:geranylgeranylglycerol-phosphate geranylgeranyltransferase [Bacteroidales bacterium]